MKDCWLGLDIGGTKCAVLLASAKNGEQIRILDKIRFETHTEKGFSYAWEHLVESIDRILSQNALSGSDIEAMGISCGGPLDSRKGIILSPPNLPGWDHIELPSMLEKRFGIPAYLQNDANACALVEWKLGAGQNTRDMIFLTFGTGLGAGIIADGHLLCGHSDMAGEVGHMRLSKNGPVGYGKAGSFEGYCSGGGIGRAGQEYTRQLLENGRTPAWTRDGISTDALTARELYRYASSGDTDAKKIFETSGRMLGRGLALLVDMFNPECIVIGSMFVRCEDLLRPPMEEELQKEALPLALKDLKIVPASTGEAIGDLASIMVALYATGHNP